MNNKSILCLLAAIFIVSACEDHNGNDPGKLKSSSLYITNEGNFGDHNGSITVFDKKTHEITEQAFKKSNNKKPLAGTLQSATTYDNKIYLNMNDADKIEVVDSKTLNSIATISLTTNITALQVINDHTAFATNLYNSVPVDSVSVIDLSNMQETDQRIAVGDQPRAILKVGHFVYIANTGFSGSGKTVSVINTETRKVIKTIDVGIAPVKLILDSANQIWVVCKGLIAYDDQYKRDPENDVNGSIYVLNGENAMVVDHISINGHPNDLVLNEKDGKGYLLDDGVKIIDLNTKEVDRLLFEGNNFNAIYYSSGEKLLYIGKIPNGDYAQPGRVIRYNLNGAAADSFQTGAAPNGFIMRGL